MGKIRQTTQPRQPLSAIPNTTTIKTPTQIQTGVLAQRRIPRHISTSAYTTIQQHARRYSMGSFENKWDSTIEEPHVNDENGAFFTINCQNAPQEVREAVDHRNDHLMKFRSSLNKLSWQHRLDQVTKEYFSTLRALDEMTNPREFQRTETHLKSIEPTYSQLVEQRDETKRKRLKALKLLS